jgi:hypothetical protein
MNYIVRILEERKKEAVAPAIHPKEGMMEIALFILMLIALDIAAHRWGISSIDSPDSPEWESRQRWYGFHER